MQIRDIEYVAAVAEYHSFSRAAEKLFISQPAVSYTHLDVYKRQQMGPAARYTVHEEQSERCYPEQVFFLH